MLSKDIVDYISLPYAVDCLLTGKLPETDAAKPSRTYSFPEKADEFEGLVLALQSGAIRSKGYFSVVDLDLPALEGEISELDVAMSCASWRIRGDIRLACGSEGEATGIPPSAWWFEGAIWERSALWIADQSEFEHRRDDIAIERLVPFFPERPYGFERVLCFLDVKLSIGDLEAWTRGKSRSRSAKETKNERGAGMKPTENYEAITAHLSKLVADGKEWKTWTLVWVDVRELFKNPDALEDSDQPYKKLVEHLKAHEHELYEALRARIASVKRRR